MRYLIFSLGISMLSYTSVSASTASVHPVERFLRDRFPSLRIESSATFDAAEETVGRGVVRGVRAQVAPRDTRLVVSYPRFYNDAIVATSADQRIALRPINAHGSIGEAANGTLIYQQPYPSVDALEVPGFERSEEFLLLRDARAPLVYDYEIVEMHGVSAVVIDGGVIRFQSDRVARVFQIDAPWIVDATGHRSDRNARWTLIGNTIVRLTVNAEGLDYPIVVDPSFSFTGNLTTERRDHSATLLLNGKVLLAGGNGLDLTSELYDPANGTFSRSANLVTGRFGHTATLLQDGKVLIAGGYSGSNVLNRAELYDPITGLFSPTGPLNIARELHTATLLTNGKVLLAGGSSTSSAELYDPATGTFTVTGSFLSPRSVHTATLLPDGRVMVVGGNPSAELYDPATGAFSATGSPGYWRTEHTATLLPNGKVLIASGLSAELYNPANGTFGSVGALVKSRFEHSATLLPNGKVLLAGGDSPETGSAELYDPATDTFTATSFLNAARHNHSATLLPNGKVLIAGGRSYSVPSTYGLPWAEVYDSTSGLTTFAGTGGLGSARTSHTSTLLPNGKVLIAGGADGSGVVAASRLYDPTTGVFTATGSLLVPRAYHTATLLQSGKVLIVGGRDVPGNAIASTDLYDPATGTFSPSGSLITARVDHTATLLPNGRVLVSGGFDNIGNYLSSAELYILGNGSFAATGSMSGARVNHTATLLPNSKVLIAAGENATGPVASAELYDFSLGTFTPTGSPIAGRSSHTATLLPNGKVLMTGGNTTAELYDAEQGTFTATGSPASLRRFHTATLLADGQVLVTGGANGSTYLASAELYDPARRIFTSVSNLGSARASHTATLLTNGKVLLSGGSLSATVHLSSAELYDPAPGVAASRRPDVTSSPATLAQPASIVLGGVRFRGLSEGANGGTDNSPTNFPLVHLQRIDNDQTLLISPGSIWSDTTFTSAQSTLANGPYRLTVIANGVPSTQRIVLVSGVGFPVAPNWISATFLYVGFSVLIELYWPAVPGAQRYEVFRSSNNGPYVFVLSTDAASAFDEFLYQGTTTYLYKVRAIGAAGPSAFSQVDPATTSEFLHREHVEASDFLSIRNAVNAMRAASGLSPMNFSSGMAVGGPIKEVHLRELREALNAARSALGLQPWSYTDPTITPGITYVKLVHLKDIWAGTQ